MLLKRCIEARRKKNLYSEFVYVRALTLRLVNQNFDFEQIIFYKLASFHPSLFDGENGLRTAKLESNLMKTLKVEPNARFSVRNTAARFFDAYAVFWHVSWIENFVSCIYGKY